MAETYRMKINKWRARIEEEQRLGREPQQKHVDKLIYYVGRAETMGLDHEVTMHDTIHKYEVKAKRGADYALRLAADVLKG